MSILRMKALATAGLLFVASSVLGAQVTTGSVGGTVTDESGKPVDAVQVQVVNRATGYRSGGITRENGRYFIPNLDIGSGYAVTIRRIGFAPQTREDVTVTLGQSTQANFQLTSQAAQLSSVRIVEDRGNVFTATRTGAETSISGAELERLPSLTRDITQVVKFTPQVNNNMVSGGASAGGAYNRYNNYMIDGASQNDKFNLNGSGGVPGGATSARLISTEAVKDFQVLLTPADVRQGNFVGMAVNMITKNGTNTFTGGATYSYRDPQLAAPEQFIKDGQLKVSDVGFYLGGPIIKDRLHFFIAPEFQTKTSPATGAYTGSTLDPGSVSADTLQRIINAMKARGVDIGDGARVVVKNPLTNLTGRLDFQLNDDNRLVFRQLYNTAQATNFSRTNTTFNPSPTVQSTGFRFTSNQYNAQNTNESSTLQLYSSLPHGWTNEFFAGYNTIEDIRILPGDKTLPEMSLPVTRLTGGTIAATFGTEQFSPGNALREKVLEVANNLTIPMGSHSLLFGARYEHNNIYDNFPQQAAGVYKFASMAALEAGTPNGYAIGYVNGGVGAATFNEQQASLYGQDVWTVNDRFTLTYGLRVDIPSFIEKPARNDSVVAQFLKAGVAPVYTDAVPKTTMLWSPRIGFNWDVTGDRKNQVRGTLGTYMAPAPLILITNSFTTNGLGYVSLSCTGNQTPAFTLDAAALPHACAGQAEPTPGLAGTNVINAVDPNFKFPQYNVASLGFDRQLPWNTVFTFDGIYRKAVNGIFIIDKNLKGPRMVNGVPYTDRNGRVLYADTITATGAVTNSTQKVINTLSGVSWAGTNSGVYYVTNENTDYNWTLSGQLKRRFSDDLEMAVAYARTKSMDVQSLTSDRAVSNFQNGRSYEGLQTDPAATTSAFERPNRWMFYGTWTMPWKTTDFTWYYEAQSGFSITYTYASADVNGDGINTNDAIYIPKKATDPTEMTFSTLGSGATAITAAAQAQAFDDFITANPCLNKQRGHIMKRDTCNTPWQDRADVSFRQRFPSFLGQRLTAQLDIFNVANLINRNWGQVRGATLSGFPQQAILTQTGRTAGPLSTSMPIVTFNQSVMTNTQSTATNNGAFFASQISTTNFYSMQLTMRYSF